MSWVALEGYWVKLHQFHDSYLHFKLGEISPSRFSLKFFYKIENWSKEKNHLHQIYFIQMSENVSC